MGQVKTTTCWNLNCQRAYHSDIRDILGELSRSARWHKVALEEVGRYEDTDGIGGIKKEGYSFFFVALKNASGARATGVARHRRFADSVYKVYHAKRNTTAHRQNNQGTEAGDIDCMRQVRSAATRGKLAISCVLRWKLHHGNAL